MNFKQRAKKLATFVSLCSLFVSFIPPAWAEEVAEPVPDFVETAVPIEQEVVSITSEGKEGASIEKKGEEQSLNAFKTESAQMSALTSSGPKNEILNTKKIPQAEVQKNGGALIFSYPFTIPVGRNGLQPDLQLAYNSQDQQNENIVGSGWSLNIPYIERLNKRGVDQLYSTSTPNYFVSSIDGELVATTIPDTYGARVENGAFNTYVFTNNSWLVKDKSGVQYKFGYTAATRQDDPADSSRVFKWMLEEVRDTNDNYIKYVYAKDAGQIYPSSIVYTGNGVTDGIFQVDFLKESRPDATTSSRAGFSFRTNSRISGVSIKINNSVVRQYGLTYTAGDNGVRSMLSSITESGTDELGVTTTLPPTVFTYQAANPGWTLTPSLNLPSDITTNGEDGQRRLIDITGDGLVDAPWPGTGNAYINNANGWTFDTTWSIPSSAPFKPMDVNGDGFPDFVNAVEGTTSFATYINSGHVWPWAGAAWTPPVPVLKYSYQTNRYSDSVYKVMDLNGDGLPDIVKADDVGSGNVLRETYINNGNGWTLDPSWNLPEAITNLGADNGWKMGDLNGDGLMDLFFRPYNPYANWHIVYINNGHGWTLDSSWLIPITTNETNLGWRLMDVNQDGLSDLVMANYVGADTTSYDVRINTGQGWAAIAGWNLPAWITEYGVDKTRKIADVNGDGFMDVVKADYVGNGTTLYETYINNAKNSRLLTKVDYPQGGSASFEYKPAAQYVTDAGAVANAYPYPINTVSKSVTNDGLGNSATTTYQYEGGRQYFGGPFDKKFAGFGMVAETDPAGNVTKTYFHQGNESDTARGEYNDGYFKIGKPYRVEKYDNAGNLYQKTINKWDASANGAGSEFVKLAQTVDSEYNGDASHKDKAESYAYDNTNGNQTQKVEYGQVTGNDDGTFTDTGTDLLTTTMTYASSGGSNVINAVSQATVTDQGSTKIKESRFYYDGLALGSIGVGNQTKKEDWKTGATYINSQKAYNAYGLVQSETDPRGKVTTYEFDAFNLYPATSTNPLSQVSQYSYDYSLGKPKQVTDANGLISQTIYDGLDRVLQRNEPDLTTSSTLVTVSTMTYTDTPGAVSVKESSYLDGTTTVDAYTYYDGLGRTLQTRKQAEGGAYATKDVAYNNLGLVQQESLPYFSNGTARTAASTDPLLYTSYGYDALQRVKTVTNALGVTTNNYGDWQLTVVDPNGKMKDLLSDAYGRLIEVDEHNATSTYVTGYQYNGAGNLTKITDALGNVRNFTYDGLGRRLTAQDLHASADASFGTWTYTYDDAGNLTTRLDPKNQTVNYTYDDTNRILTEDFTGQAGTEVVSVYDTCSFGIGSVCTTSSSAITVAHQYDPRRQLKQETKTIDGTPYVTTYAYDRQGNQLLITNPDGSQIQYEYNPGGLIERVLKKETTDAVFVPVISNLDYAPSGQPSLVVYANGVSTVNTYDPAKLYRLTHRVSTLPSASKAQDISYTYDAVGNITGLLDDSATNAKKTVSYGYDDLHRLTSVTATSTPAGISGYAQTYAYDAIGNITNKSDQGNYSYGGSTSTANPHAATNIGALPLSYDDNGNLISAGEAGVPPVTGWQVNGGTWQRRRTLTIDRTKVGGPENQIDFPLLVSSTSTEFKTVANGGFVASSTGADIFFTSSDGTTKLSHELESYSGSTGAVLAWVKVPVVATSTDTVLYMYYGNTSSSVQASPTSTWDGAMKGVWHFNNNLLDATSNVNHGTNVNSTNSTSGKIGNARDFSSSSNRVTVPANASLKPNAQITVSAWIKRTGTQATDARPIWFGRTSGTPLGPYGFQLNGTSDTRLNFHLSSTTTNFNVLGSSTSTIHSTSWTHIAGTYNGSTIRYYIDNVLQGVQSASFTIGNYDTMGLGFGNAFSGGTAEWNGLLDEIHISNVARTPGWIKTEYNNQNSPSTFYALGAGAGNSSGGSSSGITYTWDYQNRMTQVVTPSGTSAYAYDPSGQRIKATTSGSTTYYPTKFYNISGATSTIKHIFVNGQALATLKGSGVASQVHYILPDHLTGSSVVTDASGAIVELMDYHPFGSIRLDEKSGAFSEQRKFTGQEYDSETGLSYMNARYQSGTWGRFLSQDPAFLSIGDGKFEQRYNRTLQIHLTNPQSLNSYSYANNNPLIYSDEDGEILPLLAIGAVVWGAVEIGLSAYDAYSTIQTVRDSNASLYDKVGSVGLFGLGLVGPGGGYKTIGSKVDDVAKGLGKGAKSSLGVEASYSRAAEHIRRDHPNRYPGLSKEDIAGLAKETHDTANVSSRIKGTNPSTGLPVNKQYYGSSKTGQVFVNTNLGTPTMFRNSSPAEYIKRASSKDLNKYGKR